MRHYMLPNETFYAAGTIAADNNAATLYMLLGILFIIMSFEHTYSQVSLALRHDPDPVIRAPLERPFFLDGVRTLAESVIIMIVTDTVPVLCLWLALSAHAALNTAFIVFRAKFGGYSDQNARSLSLYMTDADAILSKVYLCYSLVLSLWTCVGPCVLALSGFGSQIMIAQWLGVWLLVLSTGVLYTTAVLWHRRHQVWKHFKFLTDILPPDDFSRLFIILTFSVTSIMAGVQLILVRAEGSWTLTYLPFSCLMAHGSLTIMRHVKTKRELFLIFPETTSVLCGSLAILSFAYSADTGNHNISWLWMYLSIMETVLVDVICLKPSLAVSSRVSTHSHHTRPGYQGEASQVRRSPDRAEDMIFSISAGFNPMRAPQSHYRRNSSISPPPGGTDIVSPPAYETLFPSSQRV